MRSKDNPKGSKSPSRRKARRATSEEQEMSEAEELYDNTSGAFLLKYTINDKGIGQISLPPSLSMVLQSDRICISPSGGGLFIRSINHEDSRDLESSRLSA
ncbi:MAG: hypothetical protein ACE14P_05360 [Methanotrichaceae archaeon]